PGPGGAHCLGASVEHAVCENLPCPKGLPSFRDQQCQTHDRLSSKKKGLLTAVVVDDKPCELYCSPLGKESPLLVADRVLDGTPCGPYETDLCVHGRCQKIGCDGIIGSAAKEDRCGVCSGDGKTCRVVKGDFSHSRGTGYIEAAVIPAGARRIRVVEDKPAHSFLGECTTASQFCVVWFPGERRTIVSCTRIINKTTTLVNDSDCPQASRPEPQVRRCNSHPCQSR
ncbi:A disintegrin and metalloproteinase with thrombospondin motifs 17, partial [Camelus dromedarius]